MASYFDDLNLRDDAGRNTHKRPLNVDLDDFMVPAFRNTGESSDNVQQLLQTANMFNQFRRQMVTAGDRDQEEFLDNLVSQLLEEAQSNAKGPPPASKRFIQLLPTVRRDGLEKEETCIICKDNLRTSQSSVTKMPCGHYFDKDCLVPWLELHNTCPLCRHQVETDEQVKAEEEEEARAMMYG